VNQFVWGLQVAEAAETVGADADEVSAPGVGQAELLTLYNASHWPKHVLIQYTWRPVLEVDTQSGLLFVLLVGECTRPFHLHTSRAYFNQPHAHIEGERERETAREEHVLRRRRGGRAGGERCDRVHSAARPPSGTAAAAERAHPRRC
jgi:hypothetical protein